MKLLETKLCFHSKRDVEALHCKRNVGGTIASSFLANLTYFVPYIISFETKVQYCFFTTTSITWKIQWWWWWLPCKIVMCMVVMLAISTTNKFILLTKPTCQVGDMAIFSLHFFVHNIFIYLFLHKKQELQNVCMII